MFYGTSTVKMHTLKSNFFVILQNIVEDERSDREETDSEDEEETEKEKRAPMKNGPVQNGHSPLNNNHHRKTQ